MKVLRLYAFVLLSWAFAAQPRDYSPPVLPPVAKTVLVKNLKAAERHAKHVWRDTPPVNPDGTVTGYIEISRGDLRKWEFDIAANARAIDRVLPADVGSYPINYGFVPQTVSYDGDPFDVLVLGPALAGGTVVRGAVVGTMFMEDEKGLDSKVVLSPVDRNGKPVHELSEKVKQEVGGYFDRYKRHEPGKFSRVPGWGPAADGHRLVAITHAFFRQCRAPIATACRVSVK